MRAASVVIHLQYVPVFAVLTRAFTLLAAFLALVLAVTVRLANGC